MESSYDLNLDTSTTGLCDSHGSVPKNFDILAVSVSALKNIIGSHRRHTESAVHLADGFYLSNPELHFARCECRRTASCRCSTIVRKLRKSPGGHETRRSRHSLFTRYPEGGLLFLQQDAKLVKENPLKRKPESSGNEQAKIKRLHSDGGVDIGSYKDSSSPNSSSGSNEGSSTTGFSFLGAASLQKMCKIEETSWPHQLPESYYRRHATDS